MKRINERCVLAVFLFLILVAINVCLINGLVPKTRTIVLSDYPNGNPEKLLFTVDSIEEDHHGSIVTGKCYNPEWVRTYYNFGMDSTFNGIYARMNLVILCDGKNVEVPTHVFCSGDQETEGIHGATGYIAFVPEQYEDSLAERKVALIWRKGNEKIVSYLTDRTFQGNEEKTGLGE